MVRVEWIERSSLGGGIRIIADQTSAGWDFWEQEPFETRWYRRAPTAALIAKADRLARAHAPKAA